jgi:hypothetical protein
LKQLEHYLRNATLVRIYSETLRERVERLNPNVVLVEGPVDWDLLPNRPARRDPGKVRIVYPTSRVEDDLAELFIEDIRRLLTTYAGRLEMFFWGYHPRELRGHPGVQFVDPIANYDRFFRKFARFGFDVGLAPLRDDIFHRSKTNVKFREYAACGIAGIYSNVGAYARCVEDGVTGLLVSNEPGAWFDAVSRLLKDVELRQAIQEQAREYVRKRYDLQMVQQVWCSQLQEVMAHAIGGCHLFTAQPNRRSVRVSGESRSRTHGTGRIPVVKNAWVCRARRLYRVVHTLRQNGLHRTLDRIRQSLNNLFILLQLRTKLQFWSILRQTLPRGAGQA